MTDTTRVDAALARWLTEEATVRAPQRLVHETRMRIAATPQRRVFRGSIGLPRYMEWRRLANLAVVGALLLAVGFWSFYISSTGPAQSPASTASMPSTSSPVPSTSSPVAPTPSPIPTLTAVRPYECKSSNGTCLGPLPAGVYEPTTFKPTFRFSVPEGWSNPYDVPGQFDLSYDAGGQYTYPDGVEFHDALSIFANPVAESSALQEPISGVGTSAAALSSWLSTHQDLVTTAPKEVSIGGATGFVLDLSLPTGSRTAPDHCTSDHGEPRCESLFIGADPQATYGFGLVGPESAVVYLLDLPSGGTLMLAIDDVDGIDAVGLVQAATPVVESIGFAP